MKGETDMKKRFLSLLLVICLVAGLMPTTVFAANSGKAIQLGTDALNESINSTNAATVYFGQNDTDQPGAWRVIGYNGNGVASAQGDMTLLAAGNMGLVKFSTNGTNTYADSNLKAAIDALAEKLTEEETAAVNKRTLVSGSYNGENTDCVSGAQVDNAVFWPLSTAEANMVSNDIRALSTEHPDWAMYYWWLRSPGRGYGAAVVIGGGHVDNDGSNVDGEFGVRPAFNLDLNSVLFTSAAAGGKSASGMDSGLTAIGDYTDNEWKLTLLDESRNFAVTETEVSGISGGTVTLNYTGAATGTNEYISVILADENGVQSYGRVAQPTEASGTAEVTIPAGLAVGTYTLYAFSEQYNGDYMTDYASAFETVSLTVTPDKAIMLGTSGISGYDSTNGYDYIYFGNWTAPDEYTTSGPIKWRVLDDQTNTGEAGLFLLTDTLLGSGTYGGVYFGKSSYSKAWQGSAAQTWCQDFYSSNFSTGEQSAVLSTTKSDEAFTSSTYSIPFAAYENILNGDKVFFLSAQEAENSAYGFTDDAARIANYGGSAGVWWLRSPNAYFAGYAGAVIDNGTVGNNDVGDDWAARPAFNLDLTSVLFTSAAVGGKISAAESGNNQGGEAADAIFEIGDYAGNEWKLTLLDSSRKFAVTEENANGKPGDTVTLNYTGATIGENEYISVIIADSNGSALYYGRVAQPDSANGQVEIKIPASLAAGEYTLNVFSEQYNGDYMTDYASALQEISLNVLSKETTPQAVFTAAGDSSGTLSNVDASMKYSTDGGASWTDITGTTAEITGVTADKDIQVVKKGDGTATADSDAQIIDVTQAAIPAGIGKTDCTTAAQNDGTITGVDSTMEYRLSTASKWTSISGNTVSGLANGTYDVRVKANGTVLASEVATVTIGAHICAAQGDWQHDANEHWKLCACGAEVDRAAHTGGTATCTEKAVCDVCGSSYGAINPDNHTGEIVWTKTATAHSSKYSCCDAVVVAEEAHEWENGVCTECGYECQHDGGTATCTEKAVCDVCGSSYGAINPDNHTGEIVWTKTATAHSSKYSCCDAVVAAEEAHEWENGVCAECGYECQHDGGTATCTEKAVCDICGEEYGELNASNHTNLVKTEAKAVTHMTEGNIEYWYCDGCDKYFSDKAGTQEIALADTVIPKLTEHTADGSGWHSDATGHWNTCECGEKLNEAAHTFEWVIDKEATAAEAGSKHEECTVCGYAKAAVEIPATGETTSPETGDNSNIALWIAVMLAAGTALTGTVLYSRKRKYSR